MNSKTRKQLEALFPGCEFEERPKAPDAAERECRIADRKRLEAEIEAERTAPSASAETYANLLAAAEFVLDVDPGDPTAIAALRKAVDAAKLLAAWRQRKRERTESCEKLDTYTHRCNVYESNGIWRSQRACGDTWEEVITKTIAKRMSPCTPQ
jgi:hypothetical protein